MSLLSECLEGSTVEENPYQPPLVAENASGKFASTAMKYVLAILSGICAVGTFGMTVWAVSAVVVRVTFPHPSAPIPVMIAVALMDLIFCMSFSAATALAFRRGKLAVIFFYAPFVLFGAIVTVVGLS